MNPADEASGITGLVHGDASSARELRANLAVFARQTDNPQIRKLVSEVLAGRRNVREVFRTKEFNDVGLRRLGNIEKGIAQLTDEQRAELFNPDRPRTPDEVLNAMRDKYDVCVPAVETPPTETKAVPVDEDEDISVFDE